MSRLLDFGERKLGIPCPDTYSTEPDPRSAGYDSVTGWFVDVAKVTVTDLIKKAFTGLNHEGKVVDGQGSNTQIQIIEDVKEG